MEKLPSELVMDITSYISLRDKLSFACVCKNLYEIVSDNTLYSKLVFEDDAQLNKAMVLYDRKNFGNQVRHLDIANMRYDVEYLSALPTLFPRVQYLKLDDGGYDVYDSQIDEVHTNIFQVMAGNWRNIKSIVDSSSIMNVTVRLLGVVTFSHLKILELNCTVKRFPSLDEHVERRHALIGTIHNAPSLESLYLDTQHSRLLMLNYCMQLQPN